MTNRKYNWIPDVPDKRDFKFSGIETTLPNLVDLRPDDIPIVNQYNIGSCTGNGIAGVIGFLNKKAGRPIDPVSRLFIYWNERVAEGTQWQDSGAQIRDGIMSVINQGACSEMTWPYNQQLLYQPPTSAAVTEAGSKRITSGYRLDNTDLVSLKCCLANGFPIVFGMAIYESFEWSNNGFIPMPSLQSEKQLGGHCMVIVGYQNESFIVRNSWGAEWGQSGYCFIPQQYLTDSDLAADFWTLRLT